MTDVKNKQKNIFIVLGMARSGTSAIARALKALGVDLGDKLTVGNEKWNPKGFWEDNEIVYQINGKLFAELNCPSYSIKLIERSLQISTQVNSVKVAAAELLQHRFAMTENWGFKDPSTVKLLVFWQALFNELNLNEHYVIALRNPLSVAQSYKKLTGTELEIGLLLWVMHTLPALEETQGKKRVIVSYDCLLKNPREQLERIQQHLMLDRVGSSDMDLYINEFLDKKLHHYEYTLQDLKLHPASALVPLAFKIYELLLQVAQDKLRLEADEFIVAWQEIKKEFDLVYPSYGYIDTLLKNNKKLESQLRDINKSILWKMLYPFRLIDDALRNRRKKIREKRRLMKAY